MARPPGLAQRPRLERAFPDLAGKASGLPTGVYYGELCVLDAHGAPDFPALQARRTSFKELREDKPACEVMRERPV